MPFYLVFSANFELGGKVISDVCVGFKMYIEGIHTISQEGVTVPFTVTEDSLVLDVAGAKGDLWRAILPNNLDGTPLDVARRHGIAEIAFQPVLAADYTRILHINLSGGVSANLLWQSMDPDIPSAKELVQRALDISN